jgi:asparagine synthase (glutamine-hydrolysing)
MNIRESIICPDFARRVGLGDRLQSLAAHRSVHTVPERCEEYALALDHPYLTVEVERYNRVASASAVEPRHPFLDRRLVSFCMTLPSSQKLGHGWPKAILRRALAGRLPDTVRWRRGKEHLGWAFTQTLMDTWRSQTKRDIDINTELLSSYVNMEKMSKLRVSYCDGGNLPQSELVYEAAQLAVWLRRHENRPEVPTGHLDIF